MTTAAGSDGSAPWYAYIERVKAVHTERKQQRKFSLMVVPYSLIFCDCSLKFFAFASRFPLA